jgi:hypothetical protein
LKRAPAAQVGKTGFFFFFFFSFFSFFFFYYFFFYFFYFLGPNTHGSPIFYFILFMCFSARVLLPPPPFAGVIFVGEVWRDGFCRRLKDLRNIP